jgi:glycosyl transferase family 25
MTLTAQVINLDGSDARWASATAELTAAGIPFTRLPAFDGRGRSDLPLYDPAAALRRFGRHLTGGEVGCFLSHLDGARRFLATDAALGLVLEDDLACAPDAGQRLTALTRRLADMPGWWVANLGEPVRRFGSDLGGGLLRAHYFPVTTTAILWTRPGATAFVKDATRIDMPVDHWLRWWMGVHDRGLGLADPIFRVSGAASEIDAATHRRAAPRGLRYGLSKQRRLWTNKLRAMAHRQRFQRRPAD